MSQKVAILGSGVMGAQIAAHFANAQYEVYVFDINPLNPTILSKINPAPLALPSFAASLIPSSYQQNLSVLKECFLVVEAVSEKMDIKNQVYQNISSYLGPQTIIASNTSGLSITDLGQLLPETLRQRFCGVHFFNPPRYLPLVELIPSPWIAPFLLDELEGFLTSRLGKNVVRAFDTPNFIANRVGVFSILSILHHAEKLGIGLDVVDQITGSLLGRPKSATFRTMDVVGLDTLNHVVHTMDERLTSDPWHKYYHLSEWIQELIQKGFLGQKTGKGIYLKSGKEILIYDVAQKTHRAQVPASTAILEGFLSQPQKVWDECLKSKDPIALFLVATLRDLFHYTAYHLESIALNTRDIDAAIRGGFGWKLGIFELWQKLGWQKIAHFIEEERQKEKTMVKDPLPQWVLSIDQPYTATGAGYCPSQKIFIGASLHPVYKKQWIPEMFGSAKPDTGHTLRENAGVKLWCLQEGIGIISFKSKMNVIGLEVLEGLMDALSYAESHLNAVILWQHQEPFSAGANLIQAMELVKQGKINEMERFVDLFQTVSLRLKHSSVPTVAAVSGLALGGGCEFVMHCQKAVLHLETYQGLVEVGVGILPAGGGCKELARRASDKGGDIFKNIQESFMNVSMAQVSKSAFEVRKWGYVKEETAIIFHPKELLYAAHMEAQALVATGKRPILPNSPITVSGEGAYGAVKAQILNMKEGGFISEHDVKIASAVAMVLTGGEFPEGAQVPEKWFLQKEREFFLELLSTEKTQKRMEHMLSTGKPLRN